MIETTRRADEIKAGDKIAHDVIGFFDTVIEVKMVKGQVEIRTDSSAISPVLVRRPSRPLRIFV